MATVLFLGSVTLRVRRVHLASISQLPQKTDRERVQKRFLRFLYAWLYDPSIPDRELNRNAEGSWGTYDPIQHPSPENKFVQPIRKNQLERTGERYQNQKRELPVCP